jgi:hypothetical protein
MYLFSILTVATCNKQTLAGSPSVRSLMLLYAQRNG